MTPDAVKHPITSARDGMAFKQVVVKRNCYSTQIGTAADLLDAGGEMECSPNRTGLAYLCKRTWSMGSATTPAGERRLGAAGTSSGVGSISCYNSPL